MCFNFRRNIFKNTFRDFEVLIFSSLVTMVSFDGIPNIEKTIYFIWEVHVFWISSTIPILINLFHTQQSLPSFFVNEKGLNGSFPK